MSTPGFARLLEAGTVRAVAGNTPFLLDGPDRAWFVRQGHLEVFVVRHGASVDRGMRNHFLSAPQGTLLFGMDLAMAGMGLGLLAVGVVGTEVVELPVAELQALASRSEDRATLTTLVEAWVSAVSAGVTKHIVPKPRADVLLETEATATAKSSERVRPQRGIAWVRVEHGGALFIGMEPVTTGSAAPRVPLSTDTWLETVAESGFTILDTGTALADGSAWPALEGLYALVFSCEAFNTSLAAVDEHNRLTLKAERARRAQQDSLRQLAAILGGNQAEPTPAHDSDDPLVLASIAVGNAAGIHVQAAPKAGDDNAAARRDPLLELAKASGFRTRPVVLDADWWLHDQGPLLGALGEGGDPVALLPRSPTAYEVFNPATGTTEPVTAEVGGTIRRNAVMFYPPFSDQVLTGARLLRFGLRDAGRDLWMVAAMILAGGVLGLVIPVATGLIFTTIVPQAQRGQLMQVGLGMAVAALAAAAFKITQGLATVRIESRLDASINAAIMDRVLKLPTSFFRQFSSGDLGTRVQALSSMRQAISGTVVGTVLTTVTALPALGLLLWYDGRLALVAAAVLTLTVVVMVLVGRRQLDRQRVLQGLEGRLTGVVLELLNGIAKLRVAGAEGHAFAVWARAFSAQRRVAFQGRAATNLLVTYQAILPLLASVLLFGTTAAIGSGTPISTGTFLAFSAALTQVLAAVVSLGTAGITLLTAVPLYQRVRPILDAAPEVSTDKRLPGELSGDIEVNRLSFRYDPTGPLTLRDVSFRARPGEFIAFVGPSGSGKSTLLRLLLGFEQPERGSIQYDGQDLSALDVEAVRRQVGVVLQHSKIMPGDIFRNIVGSTLLTIDDAWEAARLVALDEDIKLMPMGMHTVISEGGATFSGGQRQRMLIARALAQRPRMLYLDEATSALDNRTQAVVSESLGRLQATRMVIAHRLSTVIDADRIYVLAAGEVVQEGTYESLMATEGVFRDLVVRQLL